jgi:hypothetical protein
MTRDYQLRDELTHARETAVGIAKHLLMCVGAIKCASFNYFKKLKKIKTV